MILCAVYCQVNRLILKLIKMRLGQTGKDILLRDTLGIYLVCFIMTLFCALL